MAKLEGKEDYEDLNVLKNIISEIIDGSGDPLLVCGVKLGEDGKGGQAFMHVKGDFKKLAMFMSSVSAHDPKEADRFIMALEMLILSMKLKMK